MYANSVYSRKKHGRQRKCRSTFSLLYFSIWTSLIWLVIEIWWRMVCDAVDKNLLHNSNMNIPTFFTFLLKLLLTNSRLFWYNLMNTSKLNWRFLSRAKLNQATYHKKHHLCSTRRCYLHSDLENRISDISQYICHCYTETFLFLDMFQAFLKLKYMN